MSCGAIEDSKMERSGAAQIDSRSSDTSIITELEDAIKGGSPEKRVSTLRYVTDLFLSERDRFSNEQIVLFDDVLCLLVKRVESRARAELSERLAPIDHAPSKVVQYLARDDEIAVAGPVLSSSSLLSAGDLVEIATTKSQDHLLAISGRAGLSEAVTDVIVDRGEQSVIRKLANNATAQFSEAGYSGMVTRAGDDEELTEIIGLRGDIPLKFLRELLRRATDAVLARLMAIAPPELQEEIKRVLKTIASAAAENSSSAKKLDLAEKLVRLIAEHNELTEEVVTRFAEAKKPEELAASLAVLCNAPIEMMLDLLEGPRSDLVLIPCKSAELNWLTVSAILVNRPARHKVAESTLALARKDFDKLSVESARRTLRFWQVHNKVEK
jgi:uncharacterized protein (DUF2336 family)